MRFVLASVALAIVVSGCLTSGTPVAPETLVAPPAEAAALLGYNVAGCSQHNGVIPLPMDAARGDLPEGFTPVAFDDTGANAILIVSSYDCATTEAQRGGDAPLLLEDVAEMAGFLIVDPPEELALEDANYHAVLYGIITPSEELAAGYRGWGVNIWVGNVTFETYAPQGVAVDTPVARMPHSYGGDENFTAHLDVVVRGPETVREAGMARFFVLDDNKAIVTAFDLAWTKADHRLVGQSVVRFSSGAMLPLMGEEAYAGTGSENWGEAYGWTTKLAVLPKAGAPAPDGAPAPARAAPRPLDLDRLR